jgi:hypothetical protein
MIGNNFVFQLDNSRDLLVYYVSAKRYFYLCIIFSMRNHYRNSTKRVGLVQGRNHSLIKSNLFCDKAAKVLIWL